MPTVRFLATRDGKTAIFSAPLDLTPEQTSPEGLRSVFLERTGRQAFVLHDGGVGPNLAKDSYLVRLEGDGADALEGNCGARLTDSGELNAWKVVVSTMWLTSRSKPGMFQPSG